MDTWEATIHNNKSEKLLSSSLHEKLDSFGEA